MLRRGRRESGLKVDMVKVYDNRCSFTMSTLDLKEEIKKEDEGGRRESILFTGAEEEL